MHLVIRVIRRRVLYHRDLVAELGGKPNGRFDAGMRYQSDDDELMDAVLLELQIQIRVGEATRTPMLGGDNLVWLGLELGTDLATPRAVFEALSLPRCLLNGRNVLPSLVVARTVSMMQRVEDAKPRVARGIQDFQHMRNTVIRFCNCPNAVPYLAPIGNEVVIRIDHKECGDLLFIRHLCHASSWGNAVTQVDPWVLVRWRCQRRLPSDSSSLRRYNYGCVSESRPAAPRSAVVS